MRLFPLVFCLLLAACGWRDRIDDGVSNDLGANWTGDEAWRPEPGTAPVYPPDPPIYPAKEALFDLPEGTLPTECSAGAAYPDGKVQPGFYAYPSPPENDRYMDCLLAEAKRDGGTVRVASPKSFPKVGTCYFTRVSGVSGGYGPSRREGPSSIEFDNKLSLWEYGYIGPVARSRTGDRVRACVHDLPKDCPSHDLRGIGYRVENLRTHERWVMGDSQHICRGA